MTPVGLRIEDDLAQALDLLAKAAGMTRSAWIKRALIDALQKRPDEIRDVPAFTCPTKLVSMRFPSEEVAAMESVAQQAGLTRAQWIKRTIRWQLWDRAGELRLVPSSAIHPQAGRAGSRSGAVAQSDGEGSECRQPA